MGLSASIAVAAIVLTVRQSTPGAVFSNPAAMPATSVTVVLGAEVHPDGSPSEALTYRLEGAIGLYRAGQARTLLMSGAGAEAAAMKRYAADRGVAAADIRLDGTGLRTYDSCLAIQRRFPSQSVTLISQMDHVTRAVYTCRGLGLQVQGLAVADFHGQGFYVYRLREILADVVAWEEIRLGGPIRA